ncbi:WD40/YVTN/BNR-like repeat-containing protein [candidate division KSB1 bacterium]
MKQSLNFRSYQWHKSRKAPKGIPCGRRPSAPCYSALKTYLLLIFSAFIAVPEITTQGAYAQDTINPDHLSTMEWREVGPFRGGRVVAVTGVVGDPNTYYFGGTGSSVWKTTNAGMTWSPVMDNAGTSSVGAVAVSESDHNVVYAGMGEHCLRGNISHGDGVYKSTDAGETWNHTGLTESRQIGKIIIHPDNPDIVYVAALGHVYAPPGEDRGENGVFRTTNGGATWEEVLPAPNETTGAVDMVFDPKNPRIIYATMWEVFRTGYSMSSGGPGSGMYKSTDAGTTWKRLEGGGLPEGILGRIGIAVAYTNPNVVYAMVEADDGGLFRSDDAGNTWQKMNEERNLRQRAWYYTHIYADPKSENTVYVLNTGMYKSIDNGRTFSRIGTGIHGDHHALWLNPDDPDQMIGGNDGGANVSRDGGLTWTHSQHPTPQFYGVHTDNEIPYNIYGAQQDNSTVKMSSRASGPSQTNFYAVGGGESGHIVPDPINHNIVYAGSYGGLITRYDHATGFSQNIQAWPDNPMGWGAADLKYRFQWTAPIMISEHDPTKLYHAANVLFRSTDEGMSWTQVSSDLTRDDKSKQGPSGGPITHDNTSVEYYCTIFALEESPLTPGLIWVGSDDGLVHISRDDAATWTNASPQNMPEWGLISSIEPSNFEEARAYIAVDKHEYDDYRPYAYKTTDYGRSWTLINRGFPEDDFIRCVREDPVVRGILYAGTEKSVYFSVDDGENWQPLRLNLPTVPVHDLEVKQNDLVAATHGRGFWILDDLTVIHQLRDGGMDSDRLLRPRDTYNGPGYGSVDIHFYISGEPQGEAELEIVDSYGNRVNSYSSTSRPRLSVEQGMNRFRWNMRYPGMVTVPGHPMWAASTNGPLIVPGVYTVKLTHDGTTHEQEFEVKMNPNLVEHWGTTQQDLVEQRDFLLKIRDKATEVHETVIQLRSIKSDLSALKDRIADNPDARDIGGKADEITGRLSEIEANILEVRSQSAQDPLNFPIKVNNKIAALNGVVARSYLRPTRQSYEVFDMLSAEFDEYRREYESVINAEIPELNRMVRNRNLPAVIIK